MTTPSDKTLIKAVLAGEKAAYERLYDCYAPLIRAVCYDTTANLADAQDLAQDVFMRAYEKLNRLRSPERFGKWLVGIARLRCREWRRKDLRCREKNVELDRAEYAVSDPPNDDGVELLRRMITTLPDKERLALHSFYLQGRSADDARRIMGLSRSGFYRVLERARKRLERLMFKDGEEIQ